MDTHRVGPVEFRELRIADRQVPRKPIIKAVVIECPTGCNQMLFPIFAFMGNAIKNWNFRKYEALLVRLIQGSFFLQLRFGSTWRSPGFICADCRVLLYECLTNEGTNGLLRESSRSQNRIRLFSRVGCFEHVRTIEYIRVKFNPS